MKKTAARARRSRSRHPFGAAAPPPPCKSSTAIVSSALRLVISRDEKDGGEGAPLQISLRLFATLQLDVESQQVVLAKPNSQVLEKTEMTRRRCGRYASLLHDAIVFMVAEKRKTRASQGFTAGAFSSKSGHRFLVSKMRQIQHFDHFQGLTILENDRGG